MFDQLLFRRPDLGAELAEVWFGLGMVAPEMFPHRGRELEHLLTERTLERVEFGAVGVELGLGVEQGGERAESAGGGQH